MGNDREGTGVIAESALEHLLRMEVEVVRRFVEDEEIRRLQEHAGEGETTALAP